MSIIFETISHIYTVLNRIDIKYMNDIFYTQFEPKYFISVKVRLKYIYLYYKIDILKLYSIRLNNVFYNVIFI